MFPLPFMHYCSLGGCAPVKSTKMSSATAKRVKTIIPMSRFSAGNILSTPQIISNNANGTNMAMIGLLFFGCGCRFRLL